MHVCDLNRMDLLKGSIVRYLRHAAMEIIVPAMHDAIQVNWLDSIIIRR